MHITPQEALDRIFPPEECIHQEVAAQYERTGSWWVNQAPSVNPYMPSSADGSLYVPGYPYPGL
jgi:hypothetical protein